MKALRFDPATTTLLDAHEHPLRKEIDLLRALILSVDPAIEEGVKWNTASYRTTEWFATLNGPKHVDEPMIILHAGAIARGLVLRERIADPGAWIRWLGDDRGMITFESRADITTRKKPLQAILREWITFIKMHSTSHTMITEPETVLTKEQFTASIHLVISGRDMAKYMDPAIQEILKVLADQDLQPAGPMFSYHHRRPSETFDFEIGFPVTKAITPSGRVKNSKLPAEKVVRAVYQGPYEGLAKGWMALQERVHEQKVNETGRFWECYLNNPDEVADPKDYRTELNWVIG